MLAAAADCGETLTLLVTSGADVNAPADDGTTALMAAAIIGLPAIAAILISHGADLDLTNDNGETANSLAARSGHQDIVALLNNARAKR